MVKFLLAYSPFQGGWGGCCLDDSEQIFNSLDTKAMRTQRI